MREGLAEAIAARVLELPEMRDATAVLLYGASAEEADPAPLERALRAAGVRIAYPRIAGPAELELHWVSDPGSLVSGPFGLREPAADEPSAELGEISAIVVPGIAFDAGGNRLGFGGGYYDRLLSADRLPHTVGIAYDEQVFAEVPHDAVDRPVDMVVTPTRTMRRVTSSL